jgi:hypothetical protein
MAGVGFAALAACAAKAGLVAGQASSHSSSASVLSLGSSSSVAFVNPGSFNGGSSSSYISPYEDDSGSGTVAFTGPLSGPFTDFTADPVFEDPDGGAADGGMGTAPPANAAALFGPATQGAQTGGPCLIEPEIDTLYPNNWLRPRFVWIPASTTENLFELRLHVGNQANDLVVYTTQTQWTMPAAMWDALRQDSQDVPMTVTIRGASWTGTTLTEEALGSTGPLAIAPVSAPGTVVYWAILGGEGGAGLLKGFTIGDEGVVQVLTGPQVQVNPPPAGSSTNTVCIGCHAATPDGLNVGFSADWSNFQDSIATIGQDAGAAGGVPSFLTPDARAVLIQLAGVPAYSSAHWTTGERMTLLSDTGDLHWINLEATGAQVTGIVARGSATNVGATTPAWTHDGATIVYTSLPTSSIINGRPAQGGPMDLYSVGYNGGAGGIAQPLSGAAEPMVDEYYPAISPDDQYLVYDTMPTGQNAYSYWGAELYMIPLAGGTPTRLAANDPPACGQAKSPGVTNSWAKWSPSAQTVLGKTYYWLVFSSTRDPNTVSSQGALPQLYITPIVVDGSGTITTYHSLYLWNQPDTESNHTPAWDYFEIPPVPVSDIPR